MSGWSASDTCPFCGGENMMTFGDHKPFDCVGGECLDCGFCYHTEQNQMTLGEVNERRKDYDLKPLKKLKNKER